jgi:hypothetical protein
METSSPQENKTDITTNREKDSDWAELDKRKSEAMEEDEEREEKHRKKKKKV